jgi:ribulose-phosphate 3-epimerase
MRSSNQKLDLSVSAISAAPGLFFEWLPRFRSLGISRIHIDVMDGDFVPRLGMYPEIVEEVRSLTDLPIDIHMMTNSPERLISVFAKAGANRIVPHVEPVHHLDRLVRETLESGVEAGLALNPHTDVSVIKHVVPELSSVTVMAINPGIIGHSFIKASLKKIEDTRDFLSKSNFAGQLEVDGGVTFQNIQALALAGADIAVVGAGTIFSPARPVEENAVLLGEKLTEVQRSDARPRK